MAKKKVKAKKKAKVSKVYRGPKDILTMKAFLIEAIEDSAYSTMTFNDKREVFNHMYESYFN